MLPKVDVFACTISAAVGAGAKSAELVTHAQHAALVAVGDVYCFARKERGDTFMGPERVFVFDESFGRCDLWDALDLYDARYTALVDPPEYSPYF